MHIKQVTIQGFRSYKEQTAVDPFSHKHNVVVGKNGSGKSNFFKAIQLVLGDESEFGVRLGADQRQLMLHEGAGHKIHTSYVEVVFDNSDSRIPVEGDEVVLRRTISAKQDQYTLNGKTSTKQDVSNLLETAGFSKSNPYYIVKQGKVNELSTAPVEKRLNLLKEVAGTKVYDERRKESQTAMKETHEKTQQIQKAIDNMQERIGTLQGEKDDLKKYQNFDRKRRVLEHTVFTKDLEEVRAKLQTLDTKCEEKEAALKISRADVRKFSDEIQQVEKDYRDAKAKVAQLEEEKRQVLSEQEERHGHLTQLELAIKDAEGENESVKDSKHQMNRELGKLKDTIAMKEDELAQLTPRYQAAVAEEEAASQALILKKQRRSELFAKQSRGDRFRNKEDRDRWLNSELSRINRAVNEKNRKQTEIRQKLAASKNRIRDLETEVEKLATTVDEKNEQYTRDNIAYYEEKQKKEELVGQRNNLWRKQSALQQQLEAKREDHRKRRNDLQSQMGRAALNGVEGIRKILDRWRNMPDKQEIVEGYYGLLIDIIDCDENTYTAVDTVAGNRLFYHVVDTEKTASALMNEANENKLRGEFNFLPLNQLRSGNIQYPDLTGVEAMPLFTKIRFEPEVETVVRFVFGKTLVCRYLDLAAELCKQFNMDCVTPDGDQTSRRGLMSGGYVNRRESRMMLQKLLRAIETELEAAQAELDEINQQITELQGELQKVGSSISQKETKLERIQALNEKNKMKLVRDKDELRGLKDGIEPDEKSIAALGSEIQTLEGSKESLEQEKGSELTSVLSEEERQAVNLLDREIREDTKSLKDLSEKRRALEMQRQQLNSTLQDNLTRRRDELQLGLNESSTENSNQHLLSLRREKNLVDEAAKRLRERIAELDEELDTRREARKALADEVEKLRSRERELQEKINADARELDKLVNKKVLMEKEKDDCLHKIRELSALPAGMDNAEYVRRSAKELGRELDKVNEELKKFGHINQRALDQYKTFSDQKSQLLNRQEELSRGAEAIKDLMESLEQQKYEAIIRTFQQVTRNFELVFKELVPQGRGLLTLLKGSEESNVEDSQPSMEELNQFTGIGVKVTFTGGVGEMKDMNQLSGGQKTLVALATIFAIQKCDPAPFYLFDEIDQNLDPDHRKSVGRMIERLSSNAQFITTTFRGELLEHADQFYGVKYDPTLKVSRISAITKEDAQDFIADDESDRVAMTPLPPTTSYKETSPSDVDMEELEPSEFSVHTQPGSGTIEIEEAEETMDE